MNSIKTMKIMIAAAEELHEEKLEFTNLIEHLNEALAPRGIELKRVKWNPETDGNLEDFKAKLRDCEMCLSLYWRELTGNSQEELTAAYQELKTGKNPRKLYVFFKEPTDDMTEALKDFKANFVTNFGHFYCKFENADTMNLHFILQFESYQNSLHNNLVRISDGKVSVDGRDVVNLDNVPFASLNNDYQRLQRELLELDAQIAQTGVQFAANVNDKELLSKLAVISSKREKAREEFEKYQQHLYEIALNFARHSFEQYTERMRIARELFEKGNPIEADRILNFHVIKQEADEEMQLFEKNRHNLILKIEEFHLKANTVMANTELTVSERCAQACSAYQEAVHIADRINYTDDDFSLILFEYATCLAEMNKIEDSAAIYKKALEKKRSLAIASPEKNMPGLADILNNLALQQEKLGLFNDAEKGFKEALQIRRQLANAYPTAYMSYLARSLNNLAGLQCRFENYEAAEQYYVEALDILQQLDEVSAANYLQDIAMVRNNLAVLKEKQGLYEDAEENYVESLKIRQQLCDNTDSVSIIYLQAVAESLSNLAGLYHKRGCFEEADQCYREASDIILPLSEAIPEMFLPAEAVLWSNIAGLLHDVGNYDESREIYEVALQIYNSLMDDHLEAYMPAYADLLVKYARLLTEMQIYEEGEEAFNKALEIYRQLSEDYPEVYVPEVAATLNDFANMHSITENDEDAMSYYDEALQIYIQLMDINPNRYGQYYANTLDNIAVLKDKHGFYEEAEKGYKEALEIRRCLSEKYPDVFLVDVAKSLDHLAKMQFSMGCYKEAMKNHDEALDILQKLSDAYPEVYAIKLVNAMNDNACIKEKNGYLEEAVDMLYNALNICNDMIGYVGDTIAQPMARIMSNLERMTSNEDN